MLLCRIADIISHGAVEGELRIDDFHGVFLNQYGAGMEVPMDQSLGIIHEKALYWFLSPSIQALLRQ